MRERVFTRHGKKNVIIVAPHGADDTHTITVAKEAAEIADCWAVINQGFERAPNVDADNDQANCNRVDHVVQPVVCDEFLNPLLNFVTYIKRKSGMPVNHRGWFAPAGEREHILIFHIHGVGNAIHKLANETVDIVVGYGLGNKKDSLTCELWRKNLFVDICRNLATEGDVFEASGGSNYAGRSANNLNQYFRKHDKDMMIESMQLEFPFSTRKTKKNAALAAAKLATAIEKVVLSTSYDHTPNPKFI
jgi:hypothetical protein